MLLRTLFFDNHAKLNTLCVGTTYVTNKVMSDTPSACDAVTLRSAAVIVNRHFGQH